VAGYLLDDEVGRRLGPALRTSALGRRIGPSRWDRVQAVLAPAGESLPLAYMLDTVRKVRAELAHAPHALILLKQAVEPAATHEHEAILAALQARDPEMAMATAALHGRATEERLHAFLESLSAPRPGFTEE
jgi:hypothetical protein